MPATASGSGNEAIILKRLRARDFRNCDAFKAEDNKFRLHVEQIIAEGRVGKHTIRKIKEAFDKTAAPLELLAILRKEIANQYLLGTPHKVDKNASSVPREVILSSYLP